MSVVEEKSKLRKFFLEQRLALSREDVEKKSRQINQNFLHNLLPKIYQKNLGKIFSIYVSSGCEVCATSIAEYFQEKEIEFSYPKIVGKNQPLEFLRAEKRQEFLPNKFFSKIIEPTVGEVVFPNLIILPLLAFDLDMSRLGMGGGFFDRTINFLKNQKIEITTIGLAYDFQRSRDTLPVEKTDQRLDFIVTEKTIFLAS